MEEDAYQKSLRESAQAHKANALERIDSAIKQANEDCNLYGVLLAVKSAGMGVKEAQRALLYLSLEGVEIQNSFNQLEEDTSSRLRDLRDILHNKCSCQK